MSGVAGRRQAALGLLWFGLVLGSTSCQFQALNSFSSDQTQFAPEPAVTSSDPEVRRFQEAQVVFQNNCVTCHSDFPTMSESDWISNGYVVADEPTQSLVMQRIRGSGVSGPNDMPPTETLSSSEISTISAWITGIGQDPIGSSSSSGGSSSSSSGGVSLPPAATRLASALDVISRRCSSCHMTTHTATSAPFSGATVPAFADQAQFSTDAEFENAALIDPGSPATSWIYRALLTYGDLNLMPKSGGALSADDAASLNTWITYINDP